MGYQTQHVFYAIIQHVYYAVYLVLQVIRKKDPCNKTCSLAKSSHQKITHATAAFLFSYRDFLKLPFKFKGLFLE